MFLNLEPPLRKAELPRYLRLGSETQRSNLSFPPPPTSSCDGCPFHLLPPDHLGSSYHHRCRSRFRSQKILLGRLHRVLRVSRLESLLNLNSCPSTIYNRE